MQNLTRRALLSIAGTVASTISCGCVAEGNDTAQVADVESEPATTTLRILSTSDTHGKFLPWDYTTDTEDRTGSLAQLASAIADLRNDDTILVDAGDTIQGNMAEFFYAQPLHPMLACMDAMGYDVGTLGNHEFDPGMDEVRRYIETFPGRLLLCNVYDTGGQRLADAYTILERAGVVVGLIGMVTPTIRHYNASQLAGHEVTNPVKEARAIIDEIRDEVDVLVAVCHMDLEGKPDVAGSGVLELAEACPELDLIVSAHSHKLIEGDDSLGPLIVQNKQQGQTLVCTDLTLEQRDGRWHVTGTDSYGLAMADFEPEAEVTEVAAPADEAVKAYAHEVVGTLVGGHLVPEGNSPNNPLVLCQDTPLVDLINRVQLHCSGADLSMTPIFDLGADMAPGEIRRFDVSRIYDKSNDLYVVRMTGRQLRRYLEYDVAIFETWKPGDLTLAADPKAAVYRYDMLAGLSYEIDVSKEPGSRITLLAFPDGRAVEDDDEFSVALNSHRYDTCVSVAGIVFEVDEVPELLEAGVHSELGTIREMIADYIENVCRGTIRPDCDDSWRMVGADWDPALHEEALRLADDGVIETHVGGYARGIADHAITTEELEAHRQA